MTTRTCDIPELKESTSQWLEIIVENTNSTNTIQHKQQVQFWKVQNFVNERHQDHGRCEVQKMGKDLKRKIKAHRKHLNISEWAEVVTWEGLA